MAHNSLDNVIIRLRARAKVQSDAALTDGDLLDHYLTSREESAFEALMRRHGPMVLAVCRRVADNAQDAEDAFQATFLVLLRKAASIRPRHMVGNWLYGVAFRAGMKARTVTSRQRTRERQMDMLPEAVTLESGLWDDLLPVLDQELDALPEKYRLPIVLCDLEGKTRKEVARTLNWPEGTVAGRLAQARTMLAKRLRKHGLPVSAGVLAALFGQNAVLASLPASLASATVTALGSHSAGRATATCALSANVAALADGVLKAMLIAKLKSVSILVMMLAALTLSSSFLVSALAEHGNGHAVIDLRADAVNKKADRADEIAKPAENLLLGDPDPVEKKAENDLKKLQGTWIKVTLEKDGNPFAKTANDLSYYVFQGNQFSIFEQSGKIEKQGTVKISPSENAIDLHILVGRDKGTTLLLHYELQGHLLRLAFNINGKARPDAMKTTDGSGILIYSFRRGGPVDDSDRRALQGTWNVVSHVNDGRESSKEFLARKHQWTIAADKITIRNQGGVVREGIVLLDAATKPPSLTLHVKPGLPPGPKAVEPKQEQFHCIYLLKDDTLAVCFGLPGAPRPARFVSNLDSHTSVVILRREQAKIVNEQEAEARALRLIEKLDPRDIFRDKKQAGEPIVTIHLKGSTCSDADLKEIANLPKLRLLNLTGTKITDDGLAHLAGMQHLQNLQLAETSITGAGLVYLAPLKELRSLKLQGTKLTDDSLAHLAGFTNLTDLFLSNTPITDAGLAHLAGLQNLQWLALDHTRITDAGLVHLKEMKKLPSLNLDGTKISDDGLAHLAGLTQLMGLSLDDTQVTGAGLAKLNRLTDMRWLNANRTKFTDDGLAHLAAFKRLTEVNLDGASITDAGLVHLVGLKNLTHLRIRNAKVSDRGIATLRSGLPKLTVVR